MTIKELIDKLQELDPNLRVFTKGYEDGYNDPNVTEIRNIALDVHTDWYYGAHEDADSELSEGKEVVKGIVII